MGIDRKDVRVVCHFNIPKSMEAFYQESGRAGRDQLPSQSLLYYGIDDRKRMEFILSNAESKKLESSSLQDGSSRRSLVDFKQVIEYCEGSNCRRKKILASFGEEVSELLCKKTCDACKHPNIVAKQLEELNACNVHVKNWLPQIFISSSSDMVDGKSYSEFWNRGDDESCGSEEEISESDDDLEISTSLTSSKLQPKSCLNEKMDILQRAEENYYQRNGSENKIGRPDKNSISNTLRDSSKERLSDALKKAEQRLGSLKIDFETAVTFLENECYKKYGKSGKSFYISQLASTVRWLSTATLPDLMYRLGTTTTSASTSENPTSKTIEDVHGSAGLSPPPVALPSQSILSRKQALPSIPSFSEFLNSRKGKGSPSYRLSSSKEHSLERVRERAEKRTRIL
ncbi:hypothetical protein Nepgr_015601 [Nepenthes gracilis]|uniref:DNA 3'-5' helicase n=1 Tax=Nepenthes gracilis TaxID=150966 RepID=A0AAD3SLB6_NEPGR|nr:hypothetical protein Nepgr_015601 [Nepenthes gracilis]